MEVRDINRRKIYTNEELIQEVQMLAKQLGRTPLTKEYMRYPLAFKRYGSWSKFLDAAQLTPLKRKKRYTDEQLIEEVQQLAKLLERVPTASEYKRSSLIRFRYGSWPEFLMLANLEPPKKVKNAKEFLIDDINELTRELGKVPSIASYMSVELVYLYFDSWSDFLYQVGLKEMLDGQLEYTDEELIVEIHLLAKKLKRLPVEKEYKRNGLILKRFGTWNAFLLFAELYESTECLLDES